MSKTCLRHRTITLWAHSPPFWNLFVVVHSAKILNFTRISKYFERFFLGKLFAYTNYLFAYTSFLFYISGGYDLVYAVYVFFRNKNNMG